jgi:hypothetical protein
MYRIGGIAVLDTRVIRENPELVKKAMVDKGFSVDVDKLLSLDNLTNYLCQQGLRPRCVYNWKIFTPNLS